MYHFKSVSYVLNYVWHALFDYERSKMTTKTNKKKGTQAERKLPKYISWHAGKGKYYVRYKDKSFYDSNLQRAKKRLQQLQKAEQGEIIEDVTIDSIFAAWLADHKENIKKQTAAQYISNYNCCIKPFFGSLEPLAIEPEKVKTQIQWMAANGYGTGRINITKFLLGKIFDYAIIKGYVDTNPAKAVTLPKKRWKDAAAAEKAKGKIKALTPDQQEIFEAACCNSFYGNVFLFQLATGCRIGEAMALTWDDVDCTNKKIHIRKTMASISGHLFFSTPKSLAGYRTLPLTAAAAEILENQKAINATVAHKAAHKPDAVFINQNGNYLCQQIIDRAIKEILAEIQVEDSDFPTITSHWCRHTFATRAVESGVDFKKLQYILGHSSITMTIDLYSHVLPDTLAAEFAKMPQTRTQKADTKLNKNVSGTVQ